MMIPFIVILLSACDGGGGGGSGSSSSSSSGGGSSSSSGSTSSWSTPVRLSADTGIAALDVSLAFDPDGNAMAVWQQHVFAGNVGQATASYLISGQSWSAPETIHGFDSFSVEMPQVKTGVDGTVFASWFQGVASPSEQGLVRANRYVPGEGWKGAATLEEYITRATVTPKLAMLSSGDALVVWAEQNGDTVWACFYSAGAWCADPEPAAVSAGTVSAFSVEVAADGVGGAVVVWQEREDPSDLAPDVMASRYNGTDWSLPARLEEGGPDMDADEPKIGLDSAGNGIAIWRVFANSEIRLYFNRYTLSSGWQPPELLAAGSWPELAVGANGSAVAGWLSVDGTNLHAAVFSPVSGWSIPQTTDANSSDVEYQQVAINDFGDAFIIWAQSDGIQDSIWANHYEAGTGWRGTKLLEQENSRSAHRPVIVIGNNNNAIAAWDYFGGASNEVWASRYSPQ